MCDLSAGGSQGCGSSTPQERKSAYSVSGSLTINGKAPTGARIILQPVNEDVPAPGGPVKPDGTFTFTVTDTDLKSFETPGNPEGEYSVLVLMPRDPNVLHSPDRLGGVYSKPDNPLAKVTINLGENQLEPIRLDNIRIAN